MKKIVMLLAAGLAIGMLTGCGVPKDEHQAMIDDLEAKYDKEIDTLNSELAEKDNAIKNEKAKIRTARIELDDATERIKKLQQKNVDNSKALAAEKAKVADLEDSMEVAQEETSAAKATAVEAEQKFNTLTVEYKELERRFEMYRKNMGMLGNTDSASTAAPAPVDEAPEDSAQSASSLLDEMGNL